MSVKIEDVPYNLHNLVKTIGMENFIEITKIYGGTSIYIPMHKQLLLPQRNRQMMEEYNVVNIKKISEKYHLTPAQIRNIARKFN